MTTTKAKAPPSDKPEKESPSEIIRGLVPAPEGKLVTRKMARSISTLASRMGTKVATRVVGDNLVKIWKLE